MAVGQTLQHGALDLATQPVDHGLQLEALVVRAELELAELAEHDGLLLGQHAGMQQLGQHAFHAVGMLAHIFQEQDAALDLREVRRAQQGDQHGQVAAPQRGAAADVEILDGRLAVFAQADLRHLPARALALAAEQVVEAVQHDVVHAALVVGAAEVVHQQRAGPCGGAGLGQQGQRQRREVAQAHEARAACDGLGHGLVLDARQDAREAVAAARGQRQVGTAGRRTLDGRQARGVVACKALVAAQCIGIDLHLMAHGLQAAHAALEAGLVAHGTGGRVDIDVARTLVMRMAAAAAVGGMHMAMIVVVLVAVGSAMVMCRSMRMLLCTVMAMAMAMWMFVPVGTAGAVGGMHMFVRMINGCRRGSGCLFAGRAGCAGCTGRAGRAGTARSGQGGSMPALAGMLHIARGVKTGHCRCAAPARGRRRRPTGESIPQRRPPCRQRTGEPNGRTGIGAAALAAAVAAPAARHGAMRARAAAHRARRPAPTGAAVGSTAPATPSAAAAFRPARGAMPAARRGGRVGKTAGSRPAAVRRPPRRHRPPRAWRGPRAMTACAPPAQTIARRHRAPGLQARHS